MTVEAKYQVTGYERIEPRVSDTTISPRTIQNAHVVLVRTLGKAVAFGTLAANVASKVRPPAAEHVEMVILSPAQVKAVLAGLRGHGSCSLTSKATTFTRTPCHVIGPASVAAAAFLSCRSTRYGTRPSRCYLPPVWICSR